MSAAESTAKPTGRDGAKRPSHVIHYCGECQMPVEYCCYGDQKDRCMQWLEQNLPEVYAEVSPAMILQYKTRKHKPVVVVPDFSACVRDGRFASISSVDDLKKYIVNRKE